MADDPRETRTHAHRTFDASSELYGDQLAPGALAGDYVILGTMAAGGCGTVYSARHRILSRDAAVKVMHRELASSSEMVERFIREARAANLIRHANIVDVFEFGKLEDGRPYFVMEMLHGSSLDEMVQQKGRLTAPEVLEILEPVCDALAAAHQKGIIHRDLKASNIVVEVSGNKKRVKLLDFGIAKLVFVDHMSGGLTSVGRRIGTPLSMSPEQIRGLAVDARTDIYALGVLIYYLLTGQYPFQGVDPMEIERAHLESPPPRPSRIAPVPPGIDTIVLQCMEKRVNRRYDSVLDVMEAFRNAVGDPNQERAGADVPNKVRAIGVFVEARTKGTAEASGEVLDDLANIFEMAEAFLLDAGFTLPIQDGTALLGVRLLPGEEDGSEHLLRKATFDQAVELFEMVKKRPDAQTENHVNICLHVDEAHVSKNGTDVVGGKILLIHSWAPQTNVERLCATPEALVGLQQTSCHLVSKRADSQK